MEDLSAFVTESLQRLSKRSVEKFIGDESVIVEEILCGNVDFGDDNSDKIQSVCPNVTLGEDAEASDRGFCTCEEINRILREEWVVRVFLRLRKGLHGPFTPKHVAVC